MSKVSSTHVKLYSRKKKSGYDEHTLIWRVAGKRQRKVFSDHAEAVAEQARIEKAVASGYAEAAEMSPAELAAYHTIKAQVGNVPLHELAKFWLSHNDPKFSPRKASVKTVCNEFLESRKDTSMRNRYTLQSHLPRFSAAFPTAIDKVTPQDIETYLTNTIGLSARTRHNHRVTIVTMFRWAQKHGYLPAAAPTAAALSETPKFRRSGHKLYTPEELMRILAATRESMVPWVAIGAFAGSRAAERSRITWGAWNKGAKKLVLEPDITKTAKRRLVDVLDNLAEWLRLFTGADDELICPHYDPHDMMRPCIKAAGVKPKRNALRSGYASYHLELFSNAPLTSKNCGHTIQELETTYTHIKGVTPDVAREWFEITPQKVIDFAAAKGLMAPEWKHRI